jgi:hypothetical protein
MSRRFIASPTEGIKGFIEDEGKQKMGTYTLYGEVYQPGEVPHPRAMTLAALKAKGNYDPAASSLKIPFLGGAFTVGPEVIAGLPDTAFIWLKWKHHSDRPTS